MDFDILVLDLIPITYNISTNKIKYLLFESIDECLYNLVMFILNDISESIKYKVDFKEFINSILNKMKFYLDSGEYTTDSIICLDKSNIVRFCEFKFYIGKLRDKYYIQECYVEY